MELAQFNEQNAQDINQIEYECRKALEQVFKSNFAKLAGIPGGADNATLLVLLHLPGSFFQMLCARNKVTDIEAAKKEYMNVAQYEMERMFAEKATEAQVKEVRDAQDNFK